MHLKTLRKIRKEKSMNNLSVKLLVLVSLAASSLFASESTVLVCRSESRDGINYEVRKDDSNYFVVKTQGEKVLAKMLFGPSDFSQMVNGYGGTHMYVLNRGRSGYLVIYSHKSVNLENDKSTTLVDINLFQPGNRGLNTDGPRTDFECEAP